VTSQGDNLLHARVLPNDDLVLAVTVRGNNLVAVLRPRKVAHLAAGIETVDEVCRRRGRDRDVART